MIKLYRHELSGHSHRVELFLNLLGLEHEVINVDLKNGEHKSAEFLAKNPFGQVPAIEDGDVVLSDSIAILVYLAHKYGGDAWYPQDLVTEAEVTRWLSIGANEIANGPAAARLVMVFGAQLDHDRAKQKANALLTVMDGVLANRDWLAGTAQPTIADVTGYSYIAHAPEGEVSLEPYPNVKAWLSRIANLEGFVPMTETRVGLAA